jgi:ribosomal protein S6--L-glutamate ligase
MVVSFHPLIAADRNLICAGRDPGPAEIAALKGARAVILPQGCRERLHAAAREICPHVFPNYDARFRYPGKTGQIRLFRDTGTAHPPTELFASVADFYRRHSVATFAPLPCVFKFDWGGEGETVFAVRSRAELARMLEMAAAFERSGQRGFLLQALVPAGGRAVRVVVVGEALRSYERIAAEPGAFHASLAAGGRVEARPDPARLAAAEDACREFCRRTGINLAGIDVIFAGEGGTAQPLLLEVNYFFARRGLGGSAAYYRLLRREVARWLAGLG